MKSTLKLIAVSVALLFMIGCSETVPPGHKGKILGANGYNPEMLDEGRHSVWGRDSLVLLDMTTNRKAILMNVTMNDHDSNGKSRPGLDMNFVLGFRYRLRDDPNVMKTMFNDTKVDPALGVTAPSVFAIYTDAIVQTVFRDIVSQYTPEGALANRAAVNEAVGKELSKRLTSNPIEVSDVVVTKMTLPKTISLRIKANKDRELEIIEEQAKQAIALVKEENSIVLAQKRAQRDFIDAEAAAKQNKELASGLSNSVLELRRLEIAKIQAEALRAALEKTGPGTTLILPYEAMSSIGGQQKMFQK
jgi:hypothetical protein